MKDWKTDVTGLKHVEIPEYEGWIEIRQELSIGETQTINDAFFKGVRQMPDGSIINELCMSDAKFKRAVTYIANWSIPLEPSLAVIKQLPVPMFELIDAAIERHVEESIAKNPKTATKKRKHDAVSTSASA